MSCRICGEDGYGQTVNFSYNKIGDVRRVGQIRRFGAEVIREIGIRRISLSDPGGVSRKLDRFGG